MNTEEIIEVVKELDFYIGGEFPESVKRLLKKLKSFSQEHETLKKELGGLWLKNEVLKKEVSTLNNCLKYSITKDYAELQEKYEEMEDKLQQELQELKELYSQEIMKNQISKNKSIDREKLIECLKKMEFDGHTDMGGRYFKSTEQDDNRVIIKFYSSFCEKLTDKILNELEIK